jgi:hypothetical protein
MGVRRWLMSMSMSVLAPWLNQPVMLMLVVFVMLVFMLQ